jgi:outer membrane protein assembly factor BamB
MAHTLARSPGRRFVLASAFAAGLVLAGLAPTGTGRAGDWPQWRGPNRDGRAADFKAPKEWPKELKQVWKVTVGDGVATPALVGDKLYVFSREGNSEVTRCLNADTGKEVWTEKYDTAFSGGGDKDFSGPRSSPAVAEGKVVTFGVNGTFSCLDAASGKKVWRVETEGRPMFHTSSSPIIVNKLAVTQFGG